jgi:Fe-S-cluster-containing dehydrogenase component
MQKCDFCLERGLKPICTEPCPADALFYGTMQDMAMMATLKGGETLAGSAGPSMFIRNRRGPELPPGSVVIGKGL